MFKYLFGWRSDNHNIHLVFGRAWHELIEQLYLNGYNLDGLELGFEKFMKVWRESFSPEEDNNFSPKTPTYALLAAQKYIEHYSLDKFETIDTEVAFSVPINSSGRLMYGRIDGLIRNKDGVLNEEHKTTGTNLLSNYGIIKYTPQWTLSYPSQLYLYASQLYYQSEGHNIRDVIGTRINAVSFYETKGRGLEIGFKRILVEKSSEQLLECLAEINNWYDNIEHQMEILSNFDENFPVLGCFPKADSSHSCQSWGRMCSFYPICIAYSNPLAIRERNPLGFEINFWNPMEEEATKKVEL